MLSTDMSLSDHDDELAVDSISEIKMNNAEIQEQEPSKIIDIESYDVHRASLFPNTEEETKEVESNLLSKITTQMEKTFVEEKDLLKDLAQHPTNVKAKN